MILHSFFWVISPEKTECSETPAHKTQMMGNTTFAIRQKFDIKEIK
jgi:hypothetical protein